MIQQYTDDELIDKVKKLLALANDKSDNADNEAIQALALAQKLMAKHGISMSEVQALSQKDLPIVKTACEHKWDAGYRQPLASIIAKNYRCKPFLRGKTVYFMGKQNDTDIAKAAFEFAYKFIMRRGNQEYERARKLGQNTQGVFNSYATGFLSGLNQVLESQSRALMIVIPEEVETAFSELNAAKASGGIRHSGENFDSIAYENGRTDAINQYSTKFLNN